MTSNFDTSDRNAQKGGDFVPRLAMINDIAGFGRCSTTVSLPVISVMKVQVCPVPTSVLSNHLGFPLCHFDDYTSHMRDYIKVWNELGLTFDGLYCGFLGNEEQIDIVREFVEMFRPPLFLLDPVMGDHGRVYSSITETHVQKMKELLPLADIITPNITEAYLLTGTPWIRRMAPAINTPYDFFFSIMMISSFGFFFIIPISSVGYVRIQCIEKVACLKEPECVFFTMPVYT